MKTLISSIILVITVSFAVLTGTGAANATALRFNAPVSASQDNGIVKVHYRNYGHRHRRYAPRRNYRRYYAPRRQYRRRSSGHSHWHRHNYGGHRHRHWGGHHH